MFVLCIHPPSLLISTTILTTKLRSWKVLVKRLFHLRTYPMISFVVLEHVLYETWEVRTRYLWCSVYEWLLLFLFFSFRNLFYYNILNLIFFSLILVGPKISKKQKKNRYGSQFKNGNFLPTIQLFHGNVCHGSPLPT
ncbi:MAG: hypothetical protein ACI90V_002264 [Bacillariaceae sp.]|jgi:hypothetical protein